MTTMLRFTEVVARRRAGAVRRRRRRVLTLRLRGAPPQPAAGRGSTTGARRRCCCRAGRCCATATGCAIPSGTSVVTRARGGRDAVVSCARRTRVALARAAYHLGQPARAGRGRRRAGCATSTTTCSTTWSRELGLAVDDARGAVRARGGRLRHGDDVGGHRHEHGHEHGHRHDHCTTRRRHRHATDVVAVSGVALTRLLQLVSPALPVGAFAYSQGLEQAVAAGWVNDEATRGATGCSGLLEHALATLGPAGAGAPVSTPGAPTTASASTHWTALARRVPRRRARLRAEERQLGAALARLAARRRRRRRRRLDGARATSRTRPMFALADRALAIPTVGTRCAGLRRSPGRRRRPARPSRLVPLGQTAGQRLLPRAGDAIPAAVDARARARRRRASAATAPGPGDRERAARDPVLAALPIMTSDAMTTTAARRRRRPGRLGQDRAGRRAVQARCATATTSPSSPTTSTPRRTRSS